MRFRMFLQGILVAAILLFLTACPGPSSVTPGTSTTLVEEGLNALNSGNTDEAKSYFESVLQSDPDNPEANAGMGVILTFEAINDLSNFLLETMSQVLPLIPSAPVRGVGLNSETVLPLAKFLIGKFMSIPRDATTRQTNGMTYEEFLQFLRNLNDKLSDAEKCLKTAIEGHASFDFHVNALDWDGDGTSEPYAPLRITDGTHTYELYEILYGIEEPVFESTPVIDQAGGDAWFDFETVSAALRGEPLPSSIGFTDSDYISIDEGELAYILALVEALKAGIDLPLTWNLTLPEDFPNPANYEDPLAWELDVLAYIDGKGDGNVDYRIINPLDDGGEWNALDPFLTFNENGATYLADFVESVQELAWAILQLDSDVENDPADIHDLTSSYYVEDVVDDQGEGQLLELVRFGTITIPLSMESEEYTMIVHLHKLKENSANYDNLKKYFPTLEWDETGATTPTYWPDETFGGLLESP
ncbi:MULTISPECIES: hypothetical protein [unclassified Thermotoga]|uniref:hypothetical protein n=1 Tax=unclassified Thermotoga TaxID=2631113 RepID=UPI000280E77C|nr:MULTISPECIES: hypothetical protein [unclassified Thermotoga]AIY87018.1 Thioredoxin [Thermotoga sp. 2812B]EJX25735.1 Thioredoxin [Thermotoga sp. EMP]